MKFTSLSSSAQVAYADLLTNLHTAAIPARGVSCFTRKIKGKTYWYVQHMVGDSKRSHYIGPDTESVRQQIARYRRRQNDAQLLKPALNRLVATCAASGLHTLTAIETRVYQALAQTGLFEAGAVVVGTHAFLHIGNMLCVQWEQPVWRTDDLDIAQEETIAVAAPPMGADLGGILRKVDKGMFAVPSLNPKHPSTNFRFRKQDLTVSLLTPLRGKLSTTPVQLEVLNAAARPLRFLDYLIEDSQAAAVPSGSGILVRVPQPGRFALHKLVVSQRRPSAETAKSRKDLAQAAAVLDVLREVRPGDIKVAADAALQMGKKFIQQLNTAADLLDVELKAVIQEAITPTGAVESFPIPSPNAW